MNLLSRDVPFKRNSGKGDEVLDAIWTVYVSRLGQLDYWVHTVFSKQTGEIFHQDGEDSGAPKDDKLRKEMLNFLRSRNPRARISDLGIDSKEFTNKEGKSDIWIHSIFDINTGEVLHDEELGINNPMLKQQTLNIKREHKGGHMKTEIERMLEIAGVPLDSELIQSTLLTESILLEAKNRVGNPDLEFYVNQANWPTELGAAKEFAREALSKWDWKEKLPKMLRQLDSATNLRQVMSIVIYPLLSGEGLGVIR